MLWFQRGIVDVVRARTAWVLAMAILLAGGAAGNTPTAATLRLGVPERDNIQYLTLWVALGAGYLQAEGLDLQLVVADVPSQSGQLLLGRLP
jgi:ABC-type nitrate/sulfonate/bicarbonate transport system substrate-binding protein